MFSIIIPTLREEKCIARLMEALLGQEYSGACEIIVADGGSDDGTLEIVRRFAGVKLIELEKPNTSTQRNAGADIASSEILIFMDADDLPPPRFLAGIERAYRRRAFAVACPWFVADSRNPILRGIYFGFNLLFWLSQWRFHTGSGVCILVRREVFQKIGGFDETLHLGEDIHLIRRAAAFGRHRHLMVPIKTSARRFEEKGAWTMVKFYARISPPILVGDWDALRKIGYEAAPYDKKTVLQEN